jgi:hypothetical protein
MTELVVTFVRSVKLKGLTVPPAPVVTDQVLLVVPPTVTFPVTAVEALAEDCNWIAMVSPLLTFNTGLVNGAPLIEIPAQLVAQVAVWFVKPPPSVIVLLVMSVFKATPVWLVKLKALTVPPAVVTVQVLLVVVPTVTVAVTGVDGLAEDVT